MKKNPCFNLKKFGMVMPFFREAFHMSVSKLQELLDEQKLSLQELSDRSGLPIDTIQAIEPQVQEVLTNLQKIAQYLNTTAPKLLELFNTPKEPDRPQGSPSPKELPSIFKEPGLTGTEGLNPVDCEAHPEDPRCS
jgi:transcriptional regulator with XRE-family HTH domain